MSTRLGPRQEWSRGRILELIRDFAAANGRPPMALEWMTAVYGERPASCTVIREFGTWGDAIRAAGFEPLAPGQRSPGPRGPRGVAIAAAEPQRRVRPVDRKKRPAWRHQADREDSLRRSEHDQPTETAGR